MADETPRVFTEGECREKFLRHVWTLIEFWEKDSRAETVHAKMTGLAFSMLVMLDGGSVALASFSVCPSPHPDDKEYHRERGENWWPTDEDAVDIAGSLHELFYQYEPK